MKTIKLEITEETADALAMLMKRFSWSDAQHVACTRYDAQRLIDAVSELQESLREAGFAHR